MFDLPLMNWWSRKLTGTTSNRREETSCPPFWEAQTRYPLPPPSLLLSPFPSFSPPSPFFRPPPSSPSPFFFPHSFLSFSLLLLWMITSRIQLCSVSVLGAGGELDSGIEGAQRQEGKSHGIYTAAHYSNLLCTKVYILLWVECSNILSIIVHSTEV